MTFEYASLFVAGHRGMVGSAVCRRLQKQEGVRLITRTRQECDLEDDRAVLQLFEQERPEAVIFAAARVGGIHANNTYPVEFMTENLRAQLATITAAYKTGVKRFLFLGSTCIYPRMAKQPITEDELLASPLEPTNEAYALAKICGLKLCQYYRRQHGVLFHSAMPTNLYGPGDNYHPENSHVLPALIRRFYEAKQAGAPNVTIWGSGKPRREFLYVDDLADALLHLIGLSDPPDWVNVGAGEDLEIIALARMVAAAVGYQGQILTDTSKPDGTPRKLVDSAAINATGWQAKMPLEQGIQQTVDDFVRSLDGKTSKAARL